MTTPFDLSRQRRCKILDSRRRLAIVCDVLLTSATFDEFIAEARRRTPITDFQLMVALANLTQVEDPAIAGKAAGFAPQDSL